MLFGHGLEECSDGCACISPLANSLRSNSNRTDVFSGVPSAVPNCATLIYPQLSYIDGFATGKTRSSPASLPPLRASNG